MRLEGHLGQRIGLEYWMEIWAQWHHQVDLACYILAPLYMREGKLEVENYITQNYSFVYTQSITRNNMNFCIIK